MASEGFEKLLSGVSVRNSQASQSRRLKAGSMMTRGSFFFFFSKLSPIYQDPHSVSFQHHNGRHTTAKKNRKSICRLLLSALFGFERATQRTMCRHIMGQTMEQVQVVRVSPYDSVCTQSLDDAAAMRINPPSSSPHTRPIILLL